MDFGSPESVKDFPGLYGHEREPDSDSESHGSKQLISKRKDKKEKDIGYAALGDSSGDEEEDGKSPLRGKLGNPFKFSKKEKREKEKKEQHREKEQKVKEAKEKEHKLKDSKEKQKEDKTKEKAREEKAKDKTKEEKLKEKEKQKEEKNREKEKTKEKGKEKGKDEKTKEKYKDSKEKLKDTKELKDSSKDSHEERKKKKKDQSKGKERKKSDPVVAVEEEPVFGVPLALAVERSKCHDGVQLPAIVRECIDFIEQNGLNCEGIYRLSGVKSKVQQLKRGYNCRDAVCLYDHEPHTVASLLKLFLRELPEPVLTAELLPLFDNR
ncbi:ralA-binding protein 1-like, partial [Pollicipes pollicipes]|uniref:ralA-binding protein 1-like n=1 Tax=Pollicipes pollicipes TaxID=41117 RepID=UPI0018850ADF